MGSGSGIRDPGIIRSSVLVLKGIQSGGRGRQRRAKAGRGRKTSTSKRFCFPNEINKIQRTHPTRTPLGLQKDPTGTSQGPHRDPTVRGPTPPSCRPPIRRAPPSSSVWDYLPSPLLIIIHRSPFTAHHPPSFESFESFEPFGSGIRDPGIIRSDQGSRGVWDQGSRDHQIISSCS